MKKFLSLTLIFGLSVFFGAKIFDISKANAAPAAQTPAPSTVEKPQEPEKPDFLTNFYACNHYVENGDTRIVIIYGILNRECHYEEISFNQSVKCHFAISQLHQIANEMQTSHYKPSDGIEKLNSIKKLGIKACDIKTGYAYYRTVL